MLVWDFAKLQTSLSSLSVVLAIWDFAPVLTATVSLSHDEVLWFEWKRLQIDDVTLWYSIDLISVFAFLFCCELYGCSRFYSFSRADVMFPCCINSGGNSGLQKHRCETALCSLSRFCSERSLSIRITYPTIPRVKPTPDGKEQSMMIAL